MPLLFLLLPPVVGFLAIGCGSFVVCALVPRLRRYALGVSLWFLVWALLSPGMLLLNTVGLGILAQGHAHVIVPLNEFAWHHVKLIAVANALVVAVIATGFALLHGWMIRRVTFALFKVYLTAVSGGVGLLFSSLAALLLLVDSVGSAISSLVFFVMLGVMLMLAAFCWRRAEEFREARPERWQPVAAEEYR
jgi:hypothetical protein